METRWYNDAPPLVCCCVAWFPDDQHGQRVGSLGAVLASMIRQLRGEAD